MRALVVLRHAGFGRNFEWALRALAAEGHEVVVAVEDGSARDAQPLGSLLELDGISEAPLGARAQPSAVAARLWLDYLRYHEAAYARAEAPRRRAADAAPLGRSLGPLVGRVAPLRAAMRYGFSALERGASPQPELVQLLHEVAPDVVAVTPLVEPGGLQTDVVRAARSLGIPTVLAVASWDNLTLKGGIHEVPDVVAVWNGAQAREAIELHGVPADRMRVTGAVAYDHWFGRGPVATRDALCAAAGVDPARPYVLYVCSSAFIAPDEGRFVLDWADAVTAADPSLQLVVRPHPENPLGGFEDALASRSGVSIHPRGGVNPTTPGARSDYFDTLWHAAAIVGINTSALVEGAIVDRPVHTILAERYRTAQTGLLHFDHLLPDAGGPLVVAASLADHAAQLQRSLAAGAASRSAANGRFVDSFIRPHGRDTDASGVLVAAIEAAAGSPAAPVPGRSYGERLTGRLAGAVSGGAVRARNRRRRASGRRYAGGP